MTVRLKSWFAVGVAAALAGGGLVAASPASAAACAPSAAVSGADTVLTFTNTSACTWTVPTGVTSADVLVVAGGGGGSALLATLSASGGGGGGLIRNSAFGVTSGAVLNVQAGAGGTRDTTGVTGGTNGSNSVFGSLTALGGGGGGLMGGSSGGSGGGAGFSLVAGFPGGAGTAGQGFAGGSSTNPTVLGGAGGGGGGGGAGGAASGPTPGIGAAVTITGSSVTYAAGGSAMGGAAANSTIGGGGRGQTAVGSTTADSGNPGTVIVRYFQPAGPVVPVPPVTAAPVFTAAQPPGRGTVGTAYSGYNFGATGTPAPTFALASGALPTGLGLSSTGLLSGTPTVAGQFTFAVSATNSVGSVSSGSVTVTISTRATTVVAPPTSVTAAAGVASLTASWGGVSGATSYTATANPGPSACTTAGTSCVLGAVAGTPYTVTVVAHAADGSDSAVSVRSNSVTPTAPPVPDSAPTTAPTTLTTSKGQITETTPGEGVTVIGTGFAANSTAMIVMYSTPVPLGTVTTDSSGGFSQPVTVPSLEAGAHNFLATGVDPSGVTRTMRLPVSVVPATAGRPSLRLSRTAPVVTSAGKAKVVTVPCAISRGVMAKCVITATTRIGKKRVVVGRGSYTTSGSEGMREVNVPVTLTSRVKKATAKPGGALITFRAVVTQRGQSATTRVSKTGHVVAQKYTLAHWVRFNAKSSKVSRAEGRYLKSVRGKLTGATVVTCAGHAAEGTRAKSVATAQRRAIAVCGALTRGLHAQKVIRTVVEKKLSAKKKSAKALARQRRVDVTVAN